MKVRPLVNRELDAEEAEMFSLLLAPAVSLAYAGHEGVGDEVIGFAAPPDQAEWQPCPLAASLSEALREGGVRVVATSG